MESYYQLREGQLFRFEGNYVRQGGRIIAPPTPAALKAIGYYRLRDVEKPPYDEECEELQCTYTQVGDFILPRYTVIPKEEAV